MDLVRLHNEEKHRADMFGVKVGMLREDLEEATGQVLRLETFQTALKSESDRLRDELGAANGSIVLLESDLAQARSKAAEMEAISAERDRAKELLID
ncbi:hypothetical protein LINPERHAP2_LOCUS17099, partial [Linum perenne]